VAVATCCLDLMAKAVRHVLLTACAAADSNVRSLAITAVFRVFHDNYALGLTVLQEMCNCSLWYGLVRPRKLEAFAGCALGLFFERQGDQRLLQDLKEMVRELIARVRGLRLAIWLVPKAASFLWGATPDDYNIANMAEFKAYKKHVAKHPDLVNATNEMIDFVDSTHGTSEQFAQAVLRLDAATGLPATFLGSLATQQAVESRTLAGDASALDAAYQSVKGMASPPAFHVQEFLWRLRIVQVGRNLTGKLPLAEVWTTRAEEFIRDFMYKHRGVYQGACDVYALAAMVSGAVFVAHQLGRGRLDLLKELIDWAVGQTTIPRSANTQWKRQPDAILMRLIEVVGVEAGLSDPLSRETALFGLQCFLQHARTFDDFLWDRTATILTRMSIYHPSAVSQFLAGIDGEYREALQRRMNQILPQENVGSLLSSYRLEAFIASVMAEPPGRKDSFRNVWLECFRMLLGPKSLEATLRCVMQKLVELLRGGSENAPLKEI
jgi:hypothetical protein